MCFGCVGDNIKDVEERLSVVYTHLAEQTHCRPGDSFIKLCAGFMSKGGVWTKQKVLTHKNIVIYN